MPKPKIDLFDLSTQIEEPTGPTGMSDALLKEVLERRAQIAAKMVSGACKSFEAYADAVGGYRQIDWVLKYADRKAEAARAALGPIVDDDEEEDLIPEN